jgi:hypothetical protein
MLGTAEKPKVAVVAPEDVSYGLARMYEGFTNDVPWEFVVFRAAAAALAWLGLPENLMDDLHQDAQEGIAPNGVPAAPVDSSNATDEPPSVS